MLNSAIKRGKWFIIRDVSAVIPGVARRISGVVIRVVGSAIIVCVVVWWIRGVALVGVCRVILIGIGVVVGRVRCVVRWISCCTISCSRVSIICRISIVCSITIFDPIIIRRGVCRCVVISCIVISCCVTPLVFWLIIISCGYVFLCGSFISSCWIVIWDSDVTTLINWNCFRIITLISCGIILETSVMMIRGHVSSECIIVRDHWGIIAHSICGVVFSPVSIWIIRWHGNISWIRVGIRVVSGVRVVPRECGVAWVIVNVGRINILICWVVWIICWAIVARWSHRLLSDELKRQRDELVLTLVELKSRVLVAGLSFIESYLEEGAVDVLKLTCWRTFCARLSSVIAECEPNHLIGLSVIPRVRNNVERVSADDGCRDWVWSPDIGALLGVNGGGCHEHSKCNGNH